MFRRSGATAAQTQRSLVALDPRLLVQDSELPFPKIDSAAGIEKGLSRPQLKLAEGLLMRRPPKAVELLAVDINPRPSHPRIVRKTSSKSGRSRVSGTEITRITMGLTLRRTARKISRLKGALEIIPSA
jgi:hypothetical protein